MNMILTKVFKHNITTSLARIIFGIPFVFFGAFHFVETSYKAELLPSWLPVPEYWIYFTGSCFVAAGIAMVINKKGKIACMFLALMLTFFSLAIHLPGVFNPNTLTLEIANIMTNLALIGGALGWAYIFSHHHAAHESI